MLFKDFSFQKIPFTSLKSLSQREYSFKMQNGFLFTNFVYCTYILVNIYVENLCKKQTRVP